MPRIEYLINNPTEVELSDLELLDAEIEKYPYFYSLRALKLLALKKFNHPDFEQELQITSVFNSNPEELYQFLHAEEFKALDSVIEDKNPVVDFLPQEATTETTSSESAQEMESTEEIISVENSNSNNGSSIQIEEEKPIIEEELISEKMAHSPEEEIANNLTPEELLHPIDQEIIIENNDENLEDEINLDNSNELEISAIQDELEKEFLDNSYFTSEEIKEVNPIVEIENNQIENISSVTEDDVILSEVLENNSTSKLVKDLEEETALKEEQIIEERVEIEKPVLDAFSIENSIEAANDILEKDTMIAKAVEETKEIYETPIEQVDLVNRSNDMVHSLTDDTKGEIVSTYNAFQILNTKDEIIGGYGFDDLSAISVNNPEESSYTETILEKDFNHPIMEEEIEPEITFEEQNEEIGEVKIEEAITSTEDILIASEKIDEIEKPQGESFSFNDWLKIPQVSQESPTPSEKEMKFQIIEEFLDKNPKIKPLKKIEVPEHKAEVRDIKKTDFSDLMTETLAQIYIEQKQYEKAIKAYKILILKYPEKNSLFANQIKEIENLKNSK